MLSEIFNVWNIIPAWLNGILLVLVQTIKLLFTMPILPFTILGIICSIIKCIKHH